MSYYNQLKQFLSQAKTDNLKRIHYNSEFLGTKVKVSFGQGVPARIPWISFMKEPNTTSNGIYPVYLYYKDLEILILAYGISETYVPKTHWNIQNKQTINDFFEENFTQKPARYGSSYIFKVYFIDSFPSETEINNDLEEIIKQYLGNHNYEEKLDNVVKIMANDFNLIDFIDSIIHTGLKYSEFLTTRFVASITTKPFAILTGLSGSGKTKLAQAFVQWICKDESQYRIVPVGADWTNREPLLGYPNALKPEEYVKPDSGVLDLIIQANKQPDLPHFLILDEMNLSQVERYFADFLSVMESKEEILLHAGGLVNNGVPEKLRIPCNLFIIGTVNIDETTNMFSPKVLDRANTIEFRVTEKEMEDFLDNMKSINMEALRAKGSGMAKSFLELATVSSFENANAGNINKTLV
jgi:5-methylcytosine-specific restriction enzyme B